MTDRIFTFGKLSNALDALRAVQISMVFFTLLWSAGALADNNLRIEECPESPNRVSSLSADTRSKIDPLKNCGSFEESRSSLKSILASMRGAPIIKDEPEHVDATFTST